MGSRGKWPPPEQQAHAYQIDKPASSILDAWLAGYRAFEARFIARTGHGTTTAYTRGCRCDQCKHAYSEYQRMYRGLKK